MVGNSVFLTMGNFSFHSLGHSVFHPLANYGFRSLGNSNFHSLRNSAYRFQGVHREAQREDQRRWASSGGT